MGQIEHKNYDVVVVGGGIGGICAAVSAARNHATVALLHDRPVLGGNASSEIRMHICGASFHGNRPDAREGGILEEILLENKHRNPEFSYAIFDSILWETVHFQEGLDLYLNTQMYEVITEKNTVQSCKAKQLTTERSFNFSATIFIDCTGDGTLSYLAGAEYMKGREGKDVYQEPGAVPVSDGITMGNSIMFEAQDMGYPVEFKAPPWAYQYEEQDLMGHDKEITSGYWWIEIGGTVLDTVHDAETIRDELLKTVYGVWDHVKNRGDHGAENLSLRWIGSVPGKRESRRIKGDYVLKEQDLLQGKIFEDAVAYGGWSIDTHMPEKFANIGKDQEEDLTVLVPELYTIPYRALYSKNIQNLMLGGRLISASHRAFASTRVMGTCAVVSQATGLAAALAIEEQKDVREISLEKLQQELLKADCYIPGFKNQDAKDMARNALVSCSSSTEIGDCQQVINGISRRTREGENAWVAPFKGAPEQICLSFPTPVSLRQVRIIFDSDFSKEIMISLSDWHKVKQEKEVPETLVKDYTLRCYHNKKKVHEEKICGNYQRLRVHDFEAAVECDTLAVEVSATRGAEHIRIFEIRAYE